MSNKYDVVPFSHDEIATMVSENYSKFFRYLPKRKSWYCWTGKRWQPGSVEIVLHTIRRVCRSLAKSGHYLTESQRKDLCSSGNYAGVEKVLRADPVLKADISMFDQWPMLLNTPDGIVDLKTGKMLDHDPKYYLTRMTTVAPKAIPTPNWDAFLARVQPVPEIRAYLKRRSGYFLTASCKVQAFFLDQGKGRNGKGVYQNSTVLIMGDYAGTADGDLITVSQNEKHPEEIARLYGLRFLGVSEPDDSKNWNTARLKKMAGQDRMTGRFMGENSFEFYPEFKLAILVNDLPSIKRVNDAIKRRFQITYWTVQIPENEVDDDLLDKLKPEFPGILQHWINGCLEWQKLKGLNQPDEVRKTTNAYFEDEDKLQRWIEECLQVGTFCSNEDLYKSWCDWCEGENERPGKKTAFTKDLENKGYTRKSTGTARGFAGMELRPKTLHVPPQTTINFDPLKDWEDRPGRFS